MIKSQLLVVKDQKSAQDSKKLLDFLNVFSFPVP